MPAKACAGGTARSALEGCLAACAGDVICRAACVSEHRVGADPLEIALGACLAGACAQPCGIACAGFAQAFGPDAAASCESCTLQNECSLGTACGTDPACLGIARCRLTNPWGDRYEACRASFLDVSLVDGLDQIRPTPNAAVAACSVLDPGCSSPLSSGPPTRKAACPSPCRPRRPGRA